MSTLRLVIPQWQGGLNPDYVFGAELLSAIVPESKVDESVTIRVDKDFSKPVRQLAGVDHGDAIWRQMEETWAVLEYKKPDKTIVLGGDCAVTQVPFDYLSGKYGEGFGILWLDAHPDCADISSSTHFHEMVMGNLAGFNTDSKLTKVRHPVGAKRVFLGGLIEEDLRDKDMACKRENVLIASPEELAVSSESVLCWMHNNRLKHIAVHWDLDVLSQYDFRSIYPAEPYLDVETFPAAIGRMKIKDIGRLLRAIDLEAEIVGLSITEHMPWDAFHLRTMLSTLDIFQ